MATIFGGFGNDNLRDGSGMDSIFAFSGNDTIVLSNDGVSDVVAAGDGNDTIRIRDRAGSNSLIGGNGTDRVNYRPLNQSITVTALGQIQKAGGGIDQIVEFEVIIGDIGVGIVNTIDGSPIPGFSNAGFFDIDLSRNSLVIDGLGQTLSFEVVNFDNVIGTQNDDSIVGNRGDNVFFGSLGNDTLNGGPSSSDFDTVDYSDLGELITLLPLGEIAKGLGGTAGTDILGGVNGNPANASIEQIIGALGQFNLIDGSPVPGFANTGVFDIDLSANNLTINGLPGGALSFEVDNFFDVLGTQNDDTLVGDNDPSGNFFFAGEGNDVLNTLDGADLLVGVDDTSATPGQGELDTYIGGGGADVFSIGVAGTPFYVGGGGVLGQNDFVTIEDFEIGFDSLAFDTTTDVFQATALGLGDLEFYYDNGNGVFDRGDDLAAVINFATSELPRSRVSDTANVTGFELLTTPNVTGVGISSLDLGDRNLELLPGDIVEFDTVESLDLGDRASLQLASGLLSQETGLSSLEESFELVSL